MSLLLLVAIAFADPTPGPSVQVNQTYTIGEPIIVRMLNVPANTAVIWRVDRPAKRQSAGPQECHVWAPPGDYAGTATTIVINPDGKTLATQDYDFTFTVTGSPPDPIIDPPAAASTAPAYTVVVVESQRQDLPRRFSDRDALIHNLKPLRLLWKITRLQEPAPTDMAPYVKRAKEKGWPTYLAIVGTDGKTVIVEDAYPETIVALAAVIRKAAGG